MSVDYIIAGLSEDVIDCLLSLFGNRSQKDCCLYEIQSIGIMRAYWLEWQAAFKLLVRSSFVTGLPYGVHLH